MSRTVQTIRGVGAGMREGAVHMLHPDVTRPLCHDSGAWTDCYVIEVLPVDIVTCDACVFVARNQMTDEGRRGLAAKCVGGRRMKQHG